MEKKEIKKRLINVKISMVDNVWNIIPEDESYSRFNVKTTPDYMRKFLLRMKAKDGSDNVRSHKCIRYADMLDAIDKNGEIVLSVWKSYYPKTKEDFNRMMEA